MASIGMRHVVAASISAEGTNAMPTYGTGFIVGRAQRGSIQWERNDNDLYGDDVVAEGDNSITGGRLDVGTTELTEENEEKLLGYLHDQTGDYYEVSDDAAPYVGIGYVQVLKRFGVTIYKAIWYMKAQFGLPSEETKTKEKSIEWGTPTVSGKLFGVYNDASGKAKFRRHKRFTTYAAALTWLDALANYTAPSSSATT
ncbi:MAG: hypothetical protein K5919_05235 [Clostridiales bacterium]|nr:hypothetical protein [Clostridiales bacterium]